MMCHLKYLTLLDLYTETQIEFATLDMSIDIDDNHCFQVSAPTGIISKWEQNSVLTCP